MASRRFGVGCPAPKDARPQLSPSARQFAHPAAACGYVALRARSLGGHGGAPDMGGMM